MPQLVEDVPEFITKLKNSLKSDGKATVDVKKQANGDTNMASNFLKIAAKEGGIEVDIKANKTSAIALVVEPDDADDSDSDDTEA